MPSRGEERRYPFSLTGSASIPESKGEPFGQKQLALPENDFHLHVRAANDILLTDAAY
jgi:hypothetical protein